MVIKKGKSQVTFVFHPPGNCQEVTLVGTFNDWQPKEGKMSRQKDGSFRKRVQLEAGEHRYKFIVDGQWYADPEADCLVPNQYGTQDALITID